MLLSSFKLQNPITARSEKNQRKKNIRRLESGWRKKANPKTIPSRTKEFILENPLESAVLGAGALLGARYLIKGIKATKQTPNVLGPNNTVYNNPIISTLKNAKKAVDDDVNKVKSGWNAVVGGKPITSNKKQNNKAKILERKNKITSNLSDRPDSNVLSNINNQIKSIRSQYIDKEASKQGKGTVYLPNLTTQQIQMYQNQIKTLKSKIRQAGQKSGSGYRRKNANGNIDVVIKDSSYNLKSHLSFF